MTVDKRELRRAMSEKKRAMTAAEVESRSAMLAEKLYRTAQWRAAKAVYVYIAFNQEVRTRPIIERAWDEGKRVAVPKEVGNGMRFIWFDRFDQLAPQGAFGILEPTEDGPVADDEAALILMPGVAFDRDGHRVGYGGGYYDRWLSEHPGHPTLALCYDFQVVKDIPSEVHDIRVDAVLSD